MPKRISRSVTAMVSFWDLLMMWVQKCKGDEPQGSSLLLTPAIERHRRKCHEVNCDTHTNPHFKEILGYRQTLDLKRLRWVQMVRSNRKSDPRRYLPELNVCL